MSLEYYDLTDLMKAKQLLENPGIAIKITNLLGTPLEKGFALLPKNWNEKVGEITHSALKTALNAAVSTMKNNTPKKSANTWHKLAVAASGGVGGFFGLPALALELPVSTAIMLRSIADVARVEGEDITTADVKMACMEVFALGGTSKKDNATESGYFTVRAALAHSMSKAAAYIAEKGFSSEGAPALIRVIAQVAERFSIQVSEKAAAQAIPALGAAGGVLINTLFIDHFQDMALGHFTVRRLERKYDPATIYETYNSIKIS